VRKRKIVQFIDIRPPPPARKNRAPGPSAAVAGAMAQKEEIITQVWK
jgi:hypothetical protein